MGATLRTGCDSATAACCDNSSRSRGTDQLAEPIGPGLLLGRRLWGWRGRLALRWTLAGFIALVLAYIGSRFVVEIVLGRAG